MAHSFVQAHDDEAAAFEHFAAVPSGERDAADRHLRHGGGGAQGRRARAAAQGARHYDPGRAARQRRPHGALQECPAHPRRRGPGRGRHLSRAAGSTKTAFATSRGAARQSTASASAPASTLRPTRPALDCALQAAGIRRHAAAQALRRQGHVAGAQAGVAPL